MFPNIQSRSYGLTNKRKLYNSANGNVDFIQRLKLEKKLSVHSGCVNTLCWNNTGTTLLSGSDDQHLVISDPFTGKIVHKLHSGHRANIFSAKYLPGTGDKEVISCSGDGKIIYNNVLREDTYGTNVFDCHLGTTYKVIVIPNEASTFLSCGEDGTVRFFDLRAKTSCTKSDCKEDILINSRSAVTSIAANPLLPWQLAVGCSDSTARVYDRRMLGTRATGNYKGKGITGLISLFTPPSLENMSYRITSLSYSPDGEDILVSYSLEYIYLYATKDSSKYRELNTNTGHVHVDQIQKHRDDKHAGPSEPPVTSSAQQVDAEDPLDESGTRPSSVKRLRLRGDWSDTGPGSRPESERRQNPGPRSVSQPEAENPRITIMQRMSDLLTRWLDGNLRQNQQPDAEGQPSQPSDQPEGQSVHTPSIQEGMSVTGSLVVSLPGSQMDEMPSTMAMDEGLTCDESRSTSAAESQKVPRDVTPVSQSDVTMDTDDANLNLCDNPTEIPSEPVHSSIDNSKVKTQTDNHSVVEEPQSDMYNPLEPTSYVEQARAGMPRHLASNTENNGSSLTFNRSEASTCDNYPTALSASAECNPDCVPTNSDDVKRTGLSPEEQSIMQQTMQTVDEIKNRNVAPIISLHYSSEGTSYSNIRLRFAPLDTDSGMQIGAGAGHSVSEEQGNEIDTDPSSDAKTEGKEPEVNKAEQETTLMSASSTDVQDSISIDPSGTVKDIDRTSDTSSVRMVSDVEQCSQCRHVDGNDESPIDEQNLSDKIESQNDPTNYARFNEDYSSSVKTELSELSIGKDRGDTSAMEISESESQNDKQVGEATGNRLEAIAKCDKESGEAKDEANNEDNDSDSVREPKLTETVIVVSEMPGCSGCNESRGLASAGMSYPQPSSAFKTYTKALETDSGDQVTMDVDDESKLPSQNDQSTEGTRPKQRQRKIGYSGPPTGDFQLPSNDDHPQSSSSSDDDDEPRNVITRPRIDRTTAALRLQALHRRRQEAKEKKEMDDKSIYKPKARRVYKGHRNARTMIKEANFWGNNFILSGSDCGHIFIWDRNSTKPVMLLEADKHVVNCVQPHPFDVLLASSGIDYDIKLWSPLNQQRAFDNEKADTLIHVNEIMLEETRDTITVPAAFMLRVLASINNIRSGRRTDSSESASQGNDQEAPDSDSE